MTITDFKDSVASYSNRVAALFTTVGTLDVILQAMNDARRDAQRRYPFNLCKTETFVQLSLLRSSLLTDFKADDTGAGATVVMRRLDKLWSYASTTINSTKAYYPTKELDIRQEMMIGYAIPERPWPSQTAQLGVLPTFAYRRGIYVSHSNLTTQTWFMAHGIQFLPDLTAGDQPDIFLTYFTDWLKYATLLNLNGWLKDSEQIQIDSNIVAAAWESVKNFDSHTALSAFDLD